MRAVRRLLALAATSTLCLSAHAAAARPRLDTRALDPSSGVWSRLDEAGLRFPTFVFGAALALGLVGMWRWWRLVWTSDEVGEGAAAWSTATPPAPLSSGAFAARGAGDRTSFALTSARKAERDIEAAIRSVRGADPDFSWVVLEDFVGALYQTLHARRGAQRTDALTAYFSEEARGAYQAWGAVAVSEIVFGGVSEPAAFAVFEPAPAVEIALTVRGSFTETDRAGRARRYGCAERWWLTRAANAISRSPDEARQLGCPNCGGAIGTHDSAPIAPGTRCAACGEAVDTGAHDWRVIRIEIIERREQGATAAASGVGAGLVSPRATDVDGAAFEAYAALQARDATQRWGDFVARVSLLARAVVSASSEAELSALRTCLSTELYDVQLRRLARAKTAPPRPREVVSVELVHVGHDRYFDAITVRVRLTGAPEEVVEAAVEDVPLGYAYWTFCRAAGRRGAPEAKVRCPSCGAAPELDRSGRCRHCHASIEGDAAAAFDWIVKRIVARPPAAVEVRGGS